jgi:hypothetical protein
MRPKPTPQDNANQFTDFSANENGLGYIQNQSLIHRRILKPLCVLFSHLFFGMFISHFLEEGGRGWG